MKFKNPLSDLGRKDLIASAESQRIITSNGVVVIYTFNQRSDSPSGTLEHLFDPGKTDAKLIEILAANPVADLKKFEEALGIKILDVQHKPRPESDISAADNSDDIEIGEIE
jgi:hypothetical protein